VSVDGLVQTDERLRQALLARIHRRYATISEDVRLGERTMRFTRIADPNRVLDEVAEAEDRREKSSGQRRDGDALHLPYWAELWDSALGVGQWLLEEHAQSPLEDAAVLDLGCGMGLTGTVAAMLGARVTFADLETPALLFARLNALPWRSRVRSRQLNWRTDRLGEKYDLILGADILYEIRQWEHQEPFWREHLARRGRIVLGEPGRASGDQFIDWIQRRRWRLTQLKMPVHTRPHASPIRLFVVEDPR
jgi:predicted nicotinamide N-methyase